MAKRGSKKYLEDLRDRAAPCLTGHPLDRLSLYHRHHLSQVADLKNPKKYDISGLSKLTKKITDLSIFWHTHMAFAPF